jgi:hypothetical protein
MTRIARNWDLLVTSGALAVIVVGVTAPHIKRLGPRLDVISRRGAESAPDR